MDSKIKFIFIQLAFFGVLFGSACNRVEKSKKGQLNQVDFSHRNSIEDSIQSESLIRIERRQILEMEWLKLRMEILRMEMLLNQKKISRNSLNAKLAQFEGFNDRMPANKQFIDSGKRDAWAIRMSEKENEVEQVAAKVRLLKRDMMDLRVKIAREGFVFPEGTALTAVSGRHDD